MFKNKTYITNSIVILTTTLACSAIIINREYKPMPEPINNIALSQKITEQDIPYLTNSFYPDTITQQSNLTDSTTAKDTIKNEIKINTYVAKSGDTVSSIAAFLNLKPDTIAESNDMSISTVIKEGQVLEYPSVDGVIYKLKDEDTLWDLSVLNKVDVNKLIEINKIEFPEKLSPGKKIILPDVTKVQSVASNSSNVKKSTSSKDSSNKKPTTSKTFASRGSLPTSGTITSKYGKRWGKQHTGIDIAAPTGTNVYAFMDGKVSFSGWKTGYGKLIIIDHGNGIQSYYAHNSKLIVESGQTVKKGTHIAEVGNTGNSTGPHTHFEVRKNGTAVNPHNYIE